MEVRTEGTRPVAKVSLLKTLTPLHPALLLIKCHDLRRAELATLPITTAQHRQISVTKM